MLSFHCPCNCGRRYRLPDTEARALLHCPDSGRVFRAGDVLAPEVWEWGKTPALLLPCLDGKAPARNAAVRLRLPAPHLGDAGQRSLEIVQ